jgi:small subunit ribosomal protein S5
MEENKVTTENIPSPAPENTNQPQNKPGRFGRGGGRGGPRQGGRPGGRGRGRFGDQPRSEYDQKVIDIARVTRVTKGGKRFSFRATIIIGDGKGKVGMGIGKGVDVAQSVQKAFNKAKRNLITVPLVNGSIPYQVEAKYNSAMVMLKPAKSGVKAGGPVRVIAQMSGIKSLTGKLLSRTNNKINIAITTLNALRMLRSDKAGN